MLRGVHAADGSARGALIRTYAHPNKGRDQNEGWKQWEAGDGGRPPAAHSFLCSCRTRPGDGEKQVFIDGALSGYNNPSSLLLNEGLDLAEPAQQVDVLLSLGRGERPPPPEARTVQIADSSSGWDRW